MLGLISTSFALLQLAGNVSANNSVHTSWLWHLHQPIYWPDRAPANHAGDHYQNAWDTMQLQDGGFGHPVEHLRDVFSLNDRINAYQWEPMNTLSAIGWAANSGVQLNYSGALMENIQSLAQAGQYYGTDWYTYNRTAHTWTTTGGKPRMDLLNFTYHHALAPLLTDATLEMELRIQQRHMQILWNTPMPPSQGYFPAETCFSERIIPILKKVGINWSVIANNHLSRACPDFPLVLGSGGENCDIPNKADQINGNGYNYNRITIDRGVSPAAAIPFAYQVHYARYVDPNTGAESKLIVVPADQALGWKDSYSTWDLGLMDPINAHNDPNKPCFVMMAHDGDNAWSGGYSYYNEWIPNFTSQAVGRGYEPTTVEQFLSEFPPNSNDIVHVEDGGWEYADSDFGSPIFVNWHWPPSYTGAGGVNVVDPSTGTSSKADVWRVILATENRVRTAQQISGITPNLDQVRDPGSYSGTPNGIELGWHYYLGGLDSGFVYFGCHDDECWRPVLAQSNACRNVDGYLGDLSNDHTAPSVFIPQRQPWNPGSANYGVQYSYKVYTPTNTDFWVWTYAYDVSGITNVTLRYRSNGNAHPPTLDEFKTYAGGPDTGAWISQTLTQRSVPSATGLTPQYIADYYYTKVTGLSDTYADYYVSATDSRGNTYNSPIQHVYVAVNIGGPSSPPPTPDNLTATPVNTNQINIAWQPANTATGYILQRDGSPITNITATAYQDIGLNTGATYCYSVIASNSAGNSAATTNVCASTLLTPPPQPPPPPQNLVATTIATNRIDLTWSASNGATGYIVTRGGVPIGTTANTTYSDIGLAPGTEFCYALAATNTIGNSAETTNICATTFAVPPGMVSNLTATATGPNQIHLNWNGADWATGYIVQRGDVPVGATANTSFDDTGLSNDVQYCYAVTATNSAGSAAPSALACATTLNYFPIVIGKGPAIGTDKRGVTWYQEFQDWTTNDLRAVSPNDDEYKFNDAYDPSRDLIAFYSRQEGDSYYFRVDFFDLLLGAENQNLNVYVALSYTAGGQSYFPDSVQCNTDHPWNLCVKLYDSQYASVITPSADVTTGNWLGSYWNSDLDSVEFGIKTNAMAGWDGVSPVYFQVFTTKDFNHFGNQTDLIDVIGGSLNRNAGGGIGMLTGAIASTNQVRTAKYAAIAHANQSLGTRTQTQAHIFTKRPDLDLYPGFIRTLDTHTMFHVPLNMHISGTLLSSFLWAREDPSDPNYTYPERDGPTFLNRVKQFIQSGTGSLIGGVYAENIMPYFEGDVNRASINAFNDLALSIFGLTPGDMKVMHVPERVFQSNTNWPHASPTGPLKGQPFGDILAGGYAATYFDEVSHLHWWFYSDETNYFNTCCGGEKWAGFGGCNDRQYHHKLHKINGVLCFFINDREDQEKFGPEDGGLAKDTRYTLLDKALQANDPGNPGGYAQLTLVFDDWEAYAGNSFASSTPNNNADQWHQTVRWIANHPWIQMVNLKDVVTWAQSDTNWIYEDHGTRNDLSMQTYEYLKRSSEQDYDHWYYGSSQEENFSARIPATANNSTYYLPGTKPYGDLNTPGTLIRDAWDKVAAMPTGHLRTLAEWQYSAMIYETAWHDEDADPNTYHSRNYQLNFDVNDGCTFSQADTTYDNISGWALRLHGHIREVGILAEAAQWVQDIKNNAQGSNTVTVVKDVDDDLWNEYILKNNRVFLCFKRWGARCVAAFVYDPVAQDAVEVIGQPVANPAQESDEEDADNTRCSAFKDRWATGSATHTNYVDLDYALTAPTQGSNYWEFVSQNGQIRKRITLVDGRDVVRGDYTLGNGIGTLYVRHGFGPNQLDLLHHGDANLSVQSDNTYYGLSNSAGGAVYCVNDTNCARSTGALPQAGYQNREFPLIEEVEQFNSGGATNFTMWLAFSPTSAQSVDGDGIPNWWRLQYFGHILGSATDGSRATDDPDGDGQNNLAEYLAGTSPVDPNSALRILSVAPTAGGYVVTWSSVPGRSYQLSYRDSLTAGVWNPLPPIGATGNATTATNTPPPDVIQRFYRVEVVPIP